MKRRQFIEIAMLGASGCAAPCAQAVPAPPSNVAPAANGKVLAPRKLARVKLVDTDGKAIRAASLKPQHNYVFHYPYEATPCFLLVLERAVELPPSLLTESGARYAAAAGAGPRKNIVAYSAICAHQLAYPSKQVSFISYRAKPSPIHPTGQVIGCCAEKSVYDPADGAKVLSGPAPQPLASILIEHDARTDELYAVGVAGGDRFDAFFEKYAFKLALDMGSPDRVRKEVVRTTILRDLTAVSAQTAAC